MPVVRLLLLLPTDEATLLIFYLMTSTWSNVHHRHLATVYEANREALYCLFSSWLYLLENQNFLISETPLEQM
jgi:hypothetical protein